MFRDKGQRTNEVHVKHVTTFTFAAHAALAADKALNHPSALAELQPVGNLESTTTREKEAAAAGLLLPESAPILLSFRFRL